jgi:hypothetical protein
VTAFAPKRRAKQGGSAQGHRMERRMKEGIRCGRHHTEEGGEWGPASR